MPGATWSQNWVGGVPKGTNYVGQPAYAAKAVPESAKKPSPYEVVSKQYADIGGQVGKLEENIKRYKEKGYTNLLGQAEAQLGKLKPEYEKVSGKKKYYDDIKAAEAERDAAIKKAQDEAKAIQQQSTSEYLALVGAPRKKATESSKAAQAALKEQLSKIQQEAPEGKYAQLQKELAETKKGVGTAVQSAAQEYKTSLAQLKSKFEETQAKINAPGYGLPAGYGDEAAVSTEELNSFLQKTPPTAAEMAQDRQDALAEAKLVYEKGTAEAKTKSAQNTAEKKAAAQKLVQEKIAALQATAKENTSPAAKEKSAEAKLAKSKAQQEYKTKIGDIKKALEAEIKEGLPKARETQKAGATKVAQAKKDTAAKAAAASKLAAKKIADIKAEAKKKKII